VNRTMLILAILLIPGWLMAQEESDLQQSRDVLLYGIDSEVKELLGRFDSQGEDRFDAEILARLEESRNRSLQGEILEHFEKRNIAIAGSAVSTILTEDDELSPAFLRTAVRYLSVVAEVRSPELLARYEEIARDDDVVAASVAIGAIGTDGSAEAVELLLDLFDEFRTADLKGAVIRALGEAETTEAVELLTNIMTDPYEDSSLRQYGAESLGKIAAPESLLPLVSVLADDSSLLRAYAIAALGNFDDPLATRTLGEGLRDSFWRVRVAALQGIATRGAAESLPAIAYKARRDPEVPVRQEAIRTLAALDSADGFESLRVIAADPRAPQSDRMLAIDLLVDEDLPASMETLITVIDAEWAVENSRLLDTTARALVRTDSQLLAETYNRLLSHPNFIIRVYAIRGIGKSGFTQFGDAILTIAAENPTGILHSNAISTLEELGIPVPARDEDDAGDDGEDQTETE